MSFVTRCPACGTHFKVVRDQLLISDGWVRCGRCSRVFDAALDLHETTAGAAPGPADERPTPAPEVPAHCLIADKPWHPAEPAAFDVPAVDVQLQKALRRARAKAAKIAKAREKKDAIAAPSAPGPLAEPAAPATAKPPLPSFLENGAGHRRWRNASAMRPRALLALAALATLLLVLQVLHHERDVLSARQPALRPLLAQLCTLTGCKLAALRRIGSITIDGAAFARERAGDSYRLSFMLRNDAPIPLAMPAIELSLLDTQERALVRRVIGPVEFGAPPVLGANAEQAASLALALSGVEVAALPPVAGYRLVAFYP